jgi:hypothetical protein
MPIDFGEIRRLRLASRGRAMESHHQNVACVPRLSGYLYGVEKKPYWNCSQQGYWGPESLGLSLIMA